MASAGALAANSLLLAAPGNVRGCPQNEIYDIGTEILYVQCFVTTDMFLFSISIILEDLESSRRDLAFGCVKTRFKAILKKSNLGLGFACHSRFQTKISFDICPKEVLTMRNRFVILPKPQKLKYIRFQTKISFDICSKEVLTMRNRFFILPKPQKLNYNEFLRF